MVRALSGERDIKCPEDFNHTQFHTHEIMSDLQLQCSSDISHVVKDDFLHSGGHSVTIFLSS